LYIIILYIICTVYTLYASGRYSGKVSDRLDASTFNKLRLND